MSRTRPAMQEKKRHQAQVLNVVDLILTYCFLLLPELPGCRLRNLQISYCQRSCNHCDAGTENTFMRLSASGCVIHKSKEILLRCLCLFVFAPVLCSSWRWWQSWITDDLVQSTNTRDTCVCGFQLQLWAHHYVDCVEYSYQCTLRLWHLETFMTLLQWTGTTH